MEEVRLRSVTYAELSAIRHEISISVGQQFQAPEFLVIKYFGRYRDGAAGKDDALCMVAAAAAAREAWWSPSLILDFRDLEYHWGDEMRWVISTTWNSGIRVHEPLAVVVGDKCRDPLRSLLREKYDIDCVETVDDAYAMCRRKVQDHKQVLKDIRDKA
jgi:hypothetical protein